MRSTGYVGEQIGIRIAWRAWTTAAEGLVACETASSDERLGKWNLTHASSGLAVAWFDDPEQAQAAAAKLTGIDWVGLDPNADLSPIRALVRDAVEATNGAMAVSSHHLPSYKDPNAD